MSTTTNVSTLKINYLTQSQYDTALDNNQISENEFYLTPTEDMTTQELDDFVSELNVSGNTGTAVDLVVEQGTSGIWTYRKWSSGIAECWGSVSTETSFAVWVSPIYYGSTYCPRQAFPSGLFIDTPIEHVIVNSGNGDIWLGTEASNRPTSTHTGRYYAVRAGNLTATATFLTQFYDIGRWK